MSILATIALYNEACQIAKNQRSRDSKILKKIMNGLKKWIFRYQNIFIYMSLNFFFENLHYIFTEVKIRYLKIWYLEFRDIFTVFYSLGWLQRCATWHTYYIILLSVVRSPFWKCCINPVVFYNQKLYRRDLVGFYLNFMICLYRRFNFLFNPFKSYGRGLLQIQKMDFDSPVQSKINLLFMLIMSIYDIIWVLLYLTNAAMIILREIVHESSCTGKVNIYLIHVQYNGSTPYQIWTSNS